MKNMNKRTKMILAIVGVLVVVAIVVGVVMTQTPVGELFGTATDLVITPSNPTVGWGQTVTLTVNAKSACNWFTSNGVVSIQGDRTEVKSVVVMGGPTAAMNSATIEARCGVFNTNHVTTLVHVAPLPRISPAAGILNLNGTTTLSTGDASCKWSISEANPSGVITLNPTTGVSTTLKAGNVAGSAYVTADCRYGSTYVPVSVQ